MYSVLDKNKNKITNKAEFSNEEALMEYLKNNSFRIIKFKKLNFLYKDISSFSKSLNVRDVALFSKKLFFLESSGLNINKSLSILENQYSNKKLKSGIRIIKENLLIGFSIHQAFLESRLFSKFYCDMIKIGNESGKIDSVLDRLSKYYEIENQLKQDLKSALIYPIIVSILMFMLVISSLIYVVPNYKAIFIANNLDLPIPTILLIYISDFLINNYMLIIWFLAILSILIYYFCFYRFKIGFLFWDFIRLNFIFTKGIYNKVVSLKFSQSLFLMLDSGIGILSALESVKDIVTNSFVKKDINYVIYSIKQGVSMSDSINNTKYFNPMLKEMISIGEETGNLTAVLERCIFYFENDIKSFILKFTKLIEPIVTIVLGIILGFIMLSIMLPILYITNII